MSNDRIVDPTDPMAFIRQMTPDERHALAKRLQTDVFSPYELHAKRQCLKMVGRIEMELLDRAESLNRHRFRAAARKAVNKARRG